MFVPCIAVSDSAPKGLKARFVMRVLWNLAATKKAACAVTVEHKPCREVAGRPSCCDASHKGSEKSCMKCH